MGVARTQGVHGTGFEAGAVQDLRGYERYTRARSLLPLLTTPHTMTTPANLYPGLNDLADVLEEYPVEVSKYLTLLHEIDAKCVHSMPALIDQIDKFLDGDGQSPAGGDPGSHHAGPLGINALFEELMPSLEEKMHVSSIMVEALGKLSRRLELAYEVALQNEEVPAQLRLGAGNHPAMHLHHELMSKVELNRPGKSTQALRSESRREAMAANKKATPAGAAAAPGDYAEVDSMARHDPPVDDTGAPKRKRKRVGLTTVAPAEATAVTPAVATAVVTTAATHVPTKVYRNSAGERTNEYGEPVYCYCNQVAYGEMVGCDGEHCELEWFHLPCIGLETLPRGKWYCEECSAKR
ncbi:Pho23p KNAG_0I01920 [Huiozyma naganishii CBS 8797]|uniref:Chromatin modification-related protein n=1 Tax=Huiozyma naganishii (strain ATCC MYA-139 / BCRC 22969 / CBS 8797 / KCTC 17520 / NBRC 10181 / NCYC 3082 / Yp74L-3) TaxID=1071383 RepID=J7S2F3_HUIN7|nr:hypothetical protein KNAG_0I01920 [Kazachstania naganishii CBS 8797]CCK71977.1 hypothetical protein KNAG_0I01920 [Kazachstania naganishii CBS 8797]